MKGIIYRIFDKNINIQYFGSTFKTLENRMCLHRNKYNPCISRIIIQAGNYDCEVIKELVVQSKDELRKAEQQYIEENPCINKRRAYLSAEDKKAYSKEYFQKNREKINARKAEKHECACGAHYTQSHKSRHFKTKKHLNFVNKPDDGHRVETAKIC